MNSSDRNNQDIPQREDPGAYPIPFQTSGGVELGSRLDSIPSQFRYWAVNPNRAGAPWYKDMLEANNRYEEWLNAQPPGEYPMPFGERKRIDEVAVSSRHWGIHPDRSSFPWHLAATREPGEFLFHRGISKRYGGMQIKDVPQNIVWWALRPSNRYRGWYKPLYDANKRMLDNAYKSRSPGSEPIWFGVRYKGLRLDQVYERKGFIRWCFDPRRKESGWIYRLKDLVERLVEWRRLHPERSGSRQRRKAPDIKNPVGEAIGPWDDSLGSAEEDEYDKDSFVQSDNDELEYTSSDDFVDDDLPVNEDSEESDWSTSSGVNMSPSAHKRKRTSWNVVLSDVGSEDVYIGKLGKRYRVQHENSEE